MVRSGTLKLELEQTLDVGVGDIAIQIPELKAWLLIDKNDFQKRFDVIVDEQ